MRQNETKWDKTRQNETNETKWDKSRQMRQVETNETSGDKWDKRMETTINQEGAAETERGWTATKWPGGILQQKWRTQGRSRIYCKDPPRKQSNDALQLPYWLHPIPRQALSFWLFHFSNWTVFQMMIEDHRVGPLMVVLAVRPLCCTCLQKLSHLSEKIVSFCLICLNLSHLSHFVSICLICLILSRFVSFVSFCLIICLNRQQTFAKSKGLRLSIPRMFL